MSYPQSEKPFIINIKCMKLTKKKNILRDVLRIGLAIQWFVLWFGKKVLYKFGGSFENWWVWWFASKTFFGERGKN